MLYPLRAKFGPKNIVVLIRSGIIACALAALAVLPQFVWADPPETKAPKTPLEEFLALSEADSDDWKLSYGIGGLNHNNSHHAPGLEHAEASGGDLISFTPTFGLGLEFDQDAEWYHPSYLFGGTPRVGRLFSTTVGEELIYLPYPDIALELGSEEYLNSDWREALNSDVFYSDQTAAIHYLYTPDFGVRVGAYRYDYWSTHIEPLFGLEWRSEDRTMHATLDAPLDGKFTRHLTPVTEWYIGFSDDITEYHIETNGKLSLFDSRGFTGLRWHLTDLWTISLEYGLTVREQRKVRFDTEPTERRAQYGISDIGITVGLVFE